MSDNKFVSATFLFGAVSFLTYQLLPKSTKKRNRSEIYKTKISTIDENNEIGELENNIKLSYNRITNPITPHNTVVTTPIDSPKLNPKMINQSVLELDEINCIVESIEKFEENKKNSNTNSISSFLELYNTGSQTDTEELEFTKILNVYGTSDSVGSITPPDKIKIVRLDQQDKEYNSDLENDVNYFSADEGQKQKQKQKKKKLLKFLKRRKSN